MDLSVPKHMFDLSKSSYRETLAPMPLYEDRCTYCSAVSSCSARWLIAKSPPCAQLRELGESMPLISRAAVDAGSGVMFAIDGGGGGGGGGRCGGSCGCGAN